MTHSILATLMKKLNAPGLGRLTKETYRPLKSKKLLADLLIDTEQEIVSMANFLLSAKGFSSHTWSSQVVAHFSIDGIISIRQKKSSLVMIRSRL
jgi:hypothetical protein